MNIPEPTEAQVALTREGVDLAPSNGYQMLPMSHKEKEIIAQYPF